MQAWQVKILPSCGEVILFVSCTIRIGLTGDSPVGFSLLLITVFPKQTVNLKPPRLRQMNPRELLLPSRRRGGGASLCPAVADKWNSRQLRLCA